MVQEKTSKLNLSQRHLRTNPNVTERDGIEFTKGIGTEGTRLGILHDTKVRTRLLGAGLVDVSTPSSLEPLTVTTTIKTVALFRDDLERRSSTVLDGKRLGRVDGLGIHWW